MLYKRLGVGVVISLTLLGCGLFQGRFYSCNSDAARAHFDKLPTETAVATEKLSRMLVDQTEVEFDKAKFDAIIQEAGGVLESENNVMDYDVPERRQSYVYKLPGDVQLSTLLVAPKASFDYELWHVRSTIYVDDEEYVCGVDMDQIE